MKRNQKRTTNIDLSRNLIIEEVKSVSDSEKDYE